MYELLIIALTIAVVFLLFYVRRLERHIDELQSIVVKIEGEVASKGKK